MKHETSGIPVPEGWRWEVCSAGSERALAEGPGPCTMSWSGYHRPGDEEWDAAHRFFTQQPDVLVVDKVEVRTPEGVVVIEGKALSVVWHGTKI